MNTIMTGCRQKIPFISSSSLLVFRCFAMEKKKKKRVIQCWRLWNNKNYYPNTSYTDAYVSKITQKWNSVQKAWIAIAWIISISTSWSTGQPYEPSERPTPEDMANGLHLKSTTFTKTALSSLLSKSQTQYNINFF